MGSDYRFKIGAITKGMLVVCWVGLVLIAGLNGKLPPWQLIAVAGILSFAIWKFMSFLMK